MKEKKQKPLHKINLKPTLALDFDFEIRADSREEASNMGMSYIVRTICCAFDVEPGDVKITFGE
jgi:hypothetical protein